MKSQNISVEEAAKIMHKSQNFVIQAVENGLLPGIVLKRGSKRSAHIPRIPFEKYMNEYKQEPNKELIEALIEKYEASEDKFKKIDERILELNKKLNNLKK